MVVTIACTPKRRGSLSTYMVTGHATTCPMEIIINMSTTCISHSPKPEGAIVIDVLLKCYDAGKSDIINDYLPTCLMTDNGYIQPWFRPQVNDAHGGFVRRPAWFVLAHGKPFETEQLRYMINASGDAHSLDRLKEEE